MGKGILFDANDDEDFLNEFSTDCYYYQARLASDIINGENRLDTTSIYGLRYYTPVMVELIRQGINYRIINAPGGAIYNGGARFTLFPTQAGKRIDMYDKVFRGDVIVVRNKPIRDFDVLTKGRRDKIYTFDLQSVLSVASVNGENIETLYRYGVDYIIQVNGAAIAAQVASNGAVTFPASAAMPIISDIAIVWQAIPDPNPNGVKNPLEKDKYTVEFMASPNYVVWESMARPRATADNDLPKTLMCVKRSYFRQTENPIDQVDTGETIADQVSTTSDMHFEL